MLEIKNKSNCSGCFACYNACPKNCITMLRDNEGFMYPLVDASNCINCELCEKVCPMISQKSNEQALKKAYAVVNKNEKIRQNSSSGGVFTSIAERIINNGGVVFGAAFSDDFYKVKHILVDNIDELVKLRGSKYLQSEIGDSLRQAKTYLEKGVEVLFTGTPCQISGLLTYLGKDYKNLYTIDIICHGVPSQKVWEKYLKLRENQFASKTKMVSFRNKEQGWQAFSLAIQFKNNKEYIQELRNDLYLKGFLANLYLRPSCHNCKFKGMDRESDITIADFWGIQNIYPEFDDDKGTSLIIINNEHGENCFNSVKDEFLIKEADLNEAIKFNSAAIKPSKAHQNREKFLKESNKYKIDCAIKRALELGFFKKCKRNARRILSKIKRMVKR